MGFPTLRAARFLAILATASLAAGCSSSGGGDDQRSNLSITFSGAAPSASSDVVFLRERSAAGDLLVLDIVGRSVTPPVDGLDVVLAFDTPVVEAFGALGQTFLGTCGRTRPDNSLLLCQDNIGGSANQTGVFLFSAHPADPNPAPEMILGDRVLATLSLRAAGVGTSSLEFFVRASPAPGSGSFSRLTSASDPNGAASVSFEPDAPNVALIEVRRGR